MNAPTKLKALRTGRGLSQRSLGEASGLTQGTVSAAERGFATPKTLARLAAVLGEPVPERLLDPVPASATRADARDTPRPLLERIEEASSALGPR